MYYVAKCSACSSAHHFCHACTVNSDTTPTGNKNQQWSQLRDRGGGLLGTLIVMVVAVEAQSPPPPLQGGGICWGWVLCLNLTVLPTILSHSRTTAIVRPPAIQDRRRNDPARPACLEGVSRTRKCVDGRPFRELLRIVATSYSIRPYLQDLATSSNNHNSNSSRPSMRAGFWTAVSSYN